MRDPLPVITRTEGIDMTTPEPEDQSNRLLAPCETSFWAFLEYPVFWVPAVALTLLGFVALGVLIFTSKP
jgi:hypothetical protein